MKLWFTAKGADIVAGIVVVLGVLLLFGVVAFIAVACLRSGNEWLQALAVMLLLAAFTGIPLLFNKD